MKNKNQIDAQIELLQKEIECLKKEKETLIEEGDLVLVELNNSTWVVRVEDIDRNGISGNSLCVAKEGTGWKTGENVCDHNFTFNRCKFTKINL